ncbi:Rieske 2Fe-2S domain-containing protein [Streptomyces sp. RY43-2]|uniref:Cytochrome bc1 complex Rieske iron-sulfur subunit n=1 Tax=Streptomyces macrolidinus TaxID=2952607 RepID=A0ABT0ZCD3_9ACTN|nr:Rieske 2Fe-2S domain-containing protein [Streptomyces macrolidinus]MCN9240959.1 Rieske 2Fe-2S domain-containing protein [Streptomyces macrolidinus]
MTSEPLQSDSEPSRRTVVAAVGVTGLAAALTACGESDSTPSTKASKASNAPDKSTAEAGEHDGGAAGSGGTDLAKTSEIPEGGGKIFADQGVVVTQPSKGKFKAFSSKCTHQGCAVTSVEDGVITCPCHESRFSVADGSVQAGPAPQPLPTADIAVDGDTIKLV